MEIWPLEIPEVKIIAPDLHQDDRGYFIESFQREDLKVFDIKDDFMQDNQVYTMYANTIRGIHFQEYPCTQSKLVRCIKGSIFDVAVDLRPDSPTFGRCVSAILSDENHYQIYIPKMFGHALCTLVDDCIIGYKVDEPYSPKHDSGILWNSPGLHVNWPCRYPDLSFKDSNQPALDTVNFRKVWGMDNE